ncbi:ligase-associated DNA damage response endonuclease PdeM [Alteromonas halophila]|uniref:Metallophosphatase n=1 Tax=Alteromonas halophila TaxID=516698 RepID=A0A918MY27_9ALTE|nr:ligase-associated DNA damage response endonuclease PdeM [Alteromonas halophila]GGW83428.1 metallophosphatase [Alteromonas halophila]
MAVTEQWISNVLRNRQGTLVRFAGMAWLLDARGVAYLPEKDALVVSDLHFEKGSYLHSKGNPLPALDTRATLSRLDEVIDAYRPATVISLGDSFHDAQSLPRMTTDDQQALATLVATVRQWYWVEGNHDPDIPTELPGEAVTTVTHKTVTFTHEPDDTATYQVIGHYHPKCRQVVSRRRYRGKCFVVTPHMLIMPAFGQYTGGLDVNDEALLALAPERQRQCYMLYDERVVAVT